MPPKTQPLKSRRTRPNGQDVTEGAPAAAKFSTREYNRCRRCGCARAYPTRKFGICRICLREAAREAIPGMTKSSDGSQMLTDPISDYPHSHRLSSGLATVSRCPARS